MQIWVFEIKTKNKTLANRMQTICIGSNSPIANTATNTARIPAPDRSMRSSRSHSFSSTAKIESEIEVHPPTKRHESSGEVAAASALTNGTVTCDGTEWQTEEKRMVAFKHTDRESTETHPREFYDQKKSGHTFSAPHVEFQKIKLKIREKISKMAGLS